VHNGVNAKAAGGFSLIEAILAIGVTAIGLLGVASLMTSIIATGHLNNARDNAVAGATRKMEYLLSPQLAADSVDLTEGHHEDSEPILGDNHVPYSIAWEVARDPASGALSIDTTVSYTLSGAAGGAASGTATVRTVQLTSMRF
jgi:hypothetical protein